MSVAIGSFLLMALSFFAGRYYQVVIMEEDFKKLIAKHENKAKPPAV